MRILKDIFAAITIIACLIIVVAAVAYTPQKDLRPSLNPRQQYASIDSGSTAESLVLAINMQEALRHEYSDSQLKLLPKQYPYRMQYVVSWQNTVDSLMDVYDSIVDADIIYVKDY